MSEITIEEFLRLPTYDKPPFMVPGRVVRYVDATLAGQFEYVKPGTARFYVLHYFEASLDNYGNLKIDTKMDQVFDDTVEAPPPIDFKKYLGRSKTATDNQHVKPSAPKGRSDQEDGVLVWLSTAKAYIRKIFEKVFNG